MKAGGNMLTKVPNGFTDPNKVSSSKPEKSTKSLSREMGTLKLFNPDKVTEFFETTARLSRPLGEPEEKDVSEKGVDTKKAATTKKSGGMKVSVGGTEKKKAAAKILKKKGFKVKASEIPSRVTRKLISGDIDAAEAFEMIQASKKEKAEESKTKKAKEAEKKKAEKTPDEKGGRVLDAVVDDGTRVC